MISNRTFAFLSFHNNIAWEKSVNCSRCYVRWSSVLFIYQLHYAVLWFLNIVLRCSGLFILFLWFFLLVCDINELRNECDRECEKERYVICAFSWNSAMDMSRVRSTDKLVTIHRIVFYFFFVIVIVWSVVSLVPQIKRDKKIWFHFFLVKCLFHYSNQRLFIAPIWVFIYCMALIPAL